MRTTLIIPTRNAEPYLDALLAALELQTRQPDHVLVVDSSSSDATVPRLRAWGADVRVIDASRFNHGGTRRWASEQTDADALIYMTQDAVPADPHSFAHLLAELDGAPDIGAAYGRQLPHAGADLLAVHARAFNYPAQSQTKRLSDAPRLGIKTCFSSDAFCAYRHAAMDAVGGFPADVIGSEDAYLAARLLMAGYAVRYAASACVYHSHDYTLLQEFKRYFDIGVFYGREGWIRDAFGAAGGEGRRYVISELEMLKNSHQLHRLPEALLRSGLKLVGYRLGHMEKWLPASLKPHISMFGNYWRRPAVAGSDQRTG
ncbi:glycosyltransferase family 2 protein [Corticibacter populi]|uniref:Glycosyltransferase family 2 protein n=1 Tax=Corticibacter populi TaxID=1550736 RepID=A0A3M6QKS4_9BURK|nr:glycosyltransferase [Corticibacter populi]RMX03535.1 glycosyltransferase family 2 protein [Corticibacter populi]RZS29986.1 rhamnosyltransferase [Corticibacter populi]